MTYQRRRAAAVCHRLVERRARLLVVQLLAPRVLSRLPDRPVVWLLPNHDQRLRDESSTHAAVVAARRTAAA
jgi:mitochondrial fission protein ELM1